MFSDNQFLFIFNNFDQVGIVDEKEVCLCVDSSDFGNMQDFIDQIPAYPNPSVQNR